MRRFPLLCALSVSLSSFASSASAQDPRIIDINIQGATDVGSEYPLVWMNGWVYYRGFTPQTGVELFRCRPATPGNPSIVADIQPGPTGSHPFLATVVNGRLFFFANDGTRGAELWLTDGTTAGTRLVRDIHAGPNGSAEEPAYVSFEAPVALGSLLIFAAADASGSKQLWRSDGTAAGTIRLTSGGQGRPLGMTLFQGRVYFGLTDSTGDRELWRTDGTVAGTTPFVRFNPTGRGHPFALRVVGGTLYFHAANAWYNFELWKSDGTVAGTVMVADIAAGTAGSYPSDFVPSRNGILFSAATSTTGIELYRTDGTAAGTRLLRELRPGIYGGIAGYWQLATLGGEVLFAGDSGSGATLWKSDGTTGGTVPVANLSMSLHRPAGVAIGATAYFAASDGNRGFELYATDGTAAGTRLVADLVPGAASSHPRSMIDVGGGAFAFLAQNPSGRTSLFVSRGTAATTVELDRDVDAREPTTPSAKPFHLREFAGGVLFGANDGLHGFELWRSDGTSSGTRMVHDVRSGGASGLSNGDPTSDLPALHTIVHAGSVYYMAFDSISTPALWVTDGTNAGTRKLLQFTPESYGWHFEGAAAGGEVYFLGRDAKRFGLWATRGTVATTLKIQGGIWPVQFYPHGDHALFLRATSRYIATGLSRVGLTGVRSLANFPHKVDHHRTEYATVGNIALVLTESTPSRSAILWAVPYGAPAATLLKSFAQPIVTGSLYASGRIVTSGPFAYFPVRGAGGAADLWRTDGTAAGTSLVRAGVAPAGAMVGNLTAHDRFAYFTTASPNANELWRTDGTAAGTTREMTVPGGAHPALRIRELVSAGSRRLYFFESSGLWVTDGRTPRVVSAGWWGKDARLSGAKLYWNAYHAQKGEELAVVELTGIAHEFGLGCARGGAPRLTATDPVLGANAQVRLGSAPNTAGFWVVSPQATSTVLGYGCTAYIDLTVNALLGFRTTGTGTASVTIPVPNLASLIGAKAVLQAAVGQTRQQPLGADLSNPVLLVPGR